MARRKMYDLEEQEGKMSDKINVAFIGCGGFARGTHLPNMAKNQKYKLYAACDIIEETAKDVFEQHEMEVSV